MITLKYNWKEICYTVIFDNTYNFIPSRFVIRFWSALQSAAQQATGAADVNSQVHLLTCVCVCVCVCVCRHS